MTVRQIISSLIDRIIENLSNKYLKCLFVFRKKLKLFGIQHNIAQFLIETNVTIKQTNA